MLITVCILIGYTEYDFVVNRLEVNRYVLCLFLGWRRLCNHSTCLQLAILGVVSLNSSYEWSIKKSCDCVITDAFIWYFKPRYQVLPSAKTPSNIWVWVGVLSKMLKYPSIPCPLFNDHCMTSHFLTVFSASENKRVHSKQY